MAIPQRKSKCWTVLGSLVLVVILLMRTDRAAGDDQATPPQVRSERSIYALLYVVKEPGQADFDQYRRQQAARFKSIPVLYFALEEPEIAGLKVLKKQKDRAGWLEHQSRSEFFDDTGVLRLSLASGSPEEQALLVNAIVKGYLRFIDKFERKPLLMALEAWRKVHRSEEASLKRREADLNELLHAPRAANPQVGEARDEQVKRMKQDIAAQMASLKKIQTEIKEAETRLRALPRVRVLEWADVPQSK